MRIVFLARSGFFRRQLYNYRMVIRKYYMPAFLAACTLLSGCQGKMITAENMKYFLYTNVPIGTSMSCVEALLQKENIEYHYGEDENTIMAIIRNTKKNKTLFSATVVTESISCEFYFNNDMNLEEIKVETLFTGL